MAFKDWFNRLSEDTKLWLVQNMETPLPPEISAELVAAGGPSELSSADNEMIERINNGDDVL
jgi:hypothetical protein